ncbi:MAG: ATP phosphoribosyltransferase [Myxococcales bacterium]|nr:ATP phosphoribosyltransferase [Myxococcales bacterium]
MKAKGKTGARQPVSQGRAPRGTKAAPPPQVSPKKASKKASSPAASVTARSRLPAGAAQRKRTSPAPTVPVPPGSSRPLVLAMPRGRIMDEAVALFAKAGVDLSAVVKAKESRRLIVPVEAANMTVLIVRDTDVPAYVEYGSADLGIAGRDVLDEQGRDLYEPLDLGIGRCRMVVAEPAEKPLGAGSHLHERYATKFAEITRRYLQAQGRVAEIIKLYGSIEIAPLVGLADRIVDLVSSGETLRQHNLVEVETIMQVSARLCVGRASSRLFAARIDDLTNRLAKVL